jgi:glyoxylase-like metal-dependent hydrolase (beta-lactamase superfamily II)
MSTLLLALVATAAAAAPSPGEAGKVAGNFAVQQLAPGVHAVIRQDPPGMMVDANSLLIVNHEDVVVVDTSGAPSTARAVIAALRRITDRPVAYLVNTHWHDDHVVGNAAWQEAYPGLEVVAHARTREYLPAQGAVNRRGFLEGAPPVIAMLRRRLETGESLAGGALDEEERASYASDVALAELAVREGPGVPVVLPTITVVDRLTLHRGERVIDIRHLGAGHTAGDLVVHLPREGIVATGDLVVWPVPLVGGDQSHVGSWSGALETVRALGAGTLVPGHGPVLRDDAYLVQLAALFRAVAEGTRAALGRGESLEQVRASGWMEEQRARFAGPSKVRDLLFRTYVAGPAVAAAAREAAAASAP